MADLEEATHPDPLIQHMETLGFRADRIQDEGDYFLVDGDIGIAKKDVAEHAKVCQADPDDPDAASKLAQAAANGVVDWDEVGSIKVAIDSSLPTIIKNAITQGLSHWSNVPFTEVDISQGGSADLTFYPDAGSGPPSCLRSLPGGALAASLFPSGGNPGWAITFNTDFTFANPNRAPTEQEWVRVAAHEIGHALGLRHTDWDDRGEPVNDSNGTCSVFGANQVPRTPTSDGSSVFNAEIDAGDSWSGFSTKDKLTVRVMYPSTLTTVVTNAQVINERGRLSSEITISLNNNYHTQLKVWRAIGTNPGPNDYVFLYTLNHTVDVFGEENLTSGTRYTYRLQGINYAGDYQGSYGYVELDT